MIPVSSCFSNPSRYVSRLNPRVKEWIRKPCGRNTCVCVKFLGFCSDVAGICSSAQSGTAATAERAEVAVKGS